MDSKIDFYSEIKTISRRNCLNQTLTKKSGETFFLGMCKNVESIQSDIKNEAVRKLASVKGITCFVT